MNLEVKRYAKDKIPDVLEFENRLREEENFWGWEINDAYIQAKAYLDWICVIKSYRHLGVAQRLLKTLRETQKNNHIDKLIALTASNEEARRFYKSIPNSEMRDIGIWIDIT